MHSQNNQRPAIYIQFSKQQIAQRTMANICVVHTNLNEKLTLDSFKSILTILGIINDLKIVEKHTNSHAHLCQCRHTYVGKISLGSTYSH